MTLQGVHTIAAYGGRRAWRRALVILLVGAALVGAAGREIATAAEVSGEAGPLADPQTVKKSVWGPITLNGRSLFPTYDDLGVGIYQIQAHWDQIAPAQRPAHPRNPTDRAYRWPSYLDYAVSEAKRHDIRVLIQVIGAPRWANGGRHWRFAPDDPSDFADFAAAIAERYPHVHHWMIWGEPNRRPNFGPLTPSRRTVKTKLTPRQAQAPRIYAQLLDAAYGALKSADPDNLVIGGNTFTSAGPGAIYPYQWIRYLRLPDGSRPRMDMYGHNPFTFRKPRLGGRPSRRGAVSFNDLPRLVRALDRAYPERRLKLFLSEWGVPIGFWDHDLRYSVKAREGTRWIRAGLRIARRWGRIYSLGWVHPVDTDKNSQGLLDWNGNPKAGYRAFKGG